LLIKLYLVFSTQDVFEVMYPTGYIMQWSANSLPRQAATSCSVQETEPTPLFVPAGYIMHSSVNGSAVITHVHA